MEKYIIFAPVIIFFMFFVFLLLGFLFLLLKLLKKSQAASWQAVVVDKKIAHNDALDSHEVRTFYTLMVKTDEGKDMKLGVSAQDFHTKYQIGDRIEKKAGELFFHKIN